MCTSTGLAAPPYSYTYSYTRIFFDSVRWLSSVDAAMQNLINAMDERIDDNNPVNLQSVLRKWSMPAEVRYEQTMVPAATPAGERLVPPSPSRLPAPPPLEPELA